MLVARACTRAIGPACLHACVYGRACTCQDTNMDACMQVYNFQTRCVRVWVCARKIAARVRVLACMRVCARALRVYEHARALDAPTFIPTACLSPCPLTINPPFMKCFHDLTCS